jgi:hypothetical protein
VVKGIVDAKGDLPKLGEVLPKEICPEKRKRETIFWFVKSLQVPNWDSA